MQSRNISKNNTLSMNKLNITIKSSFFRLLIKENKVIKNGLYNVDTVVLSIM